MTTRIYIGYHVFILETLVIGYIMCAQAYLDLNLLIAFIFVSIFKAYFSNQKQKKVDIYKICKMSYIMCSIQIVLGKSYQVIS